MNGEPLRPRDLALLLLASGDPVGDARHRRIVVAVGATVPCLGHGVSPTPSAVPTAYVAPAASAPYNS